jgi:hypothetical protein
MSTFHANAGAPRVHLAWHMAENIYLFFFTSVTDILLPQKSYLHNKLISFILTSHTQVRVYDLSFSF